MKTPKTATAWSRTGLFAAILVALASVVGCATTKPAPLYLLSPSGIGVAVISPPPSAAAVVESNWVDAGGPMLEGMRKEGTFNPFLSPLGLLFAPLALAFDASQCYQKLLAAYPDLPGKASEIMQREFLPADVQDQFTAVLQEGTSSPIAREAIFLGDDQGPDEQRLIAAAAQHGRAHLFLVEVSHVSIQPFGKGCDAWKVWAKMRIQLWRVVDRQLVLSFSPGYPQPFVSGPLSDVKSIFDEPDALRSRLKPTYAATARMFSHRAMFKLPPWARRTDVVSRACARVR